jgi:hypothetical protein
MTISAGFAWIVTFGSLIGLFWLLARLKLSGNRAAASLKEESAEFSLARYQPMARLLAEDDDLNFLRLQPGYRPEIGARWQRERRRIFRCYLKELKTDFGRLHAQARQLVADSDAASAGLMAILMKQQITFMRATTALECRLLLQRVGWARPDVTPLLELIDAMRADLAQRTSPLPA